MDVRQRVSRISAEPATAFAVAALLVDLAVLLVPLIGSSLLSYALREEFPLRYQVANLLTLLAQAVAILIGLLLLRRGRAAMASGVFVGVLVILGLRVLSSVLSTTILLWEATVFLSLQAIECALLFLAARAARQSERRRIGGRT